MKKTVRVVAALLFILSCIFCVKTASNVKAEETKYNIWVGEVQVTSANKDNIPGVVGGKATYNPTTHVLNFEGAVTGVQGKYKYNIYNENDTLIFNDECDLTITGTFTPSENNVENAIVCYDDHSLTIDGASTNIIVGSLGQTIYTSGDFTITAGSVRSVSDKPNAVMCYGDMTMDSGSLLAVSNSGSDNRDVIYLSGDFNLNDGTIALNGTGYGIFSYYGHIYINGGSLQSDKTLKSGGGISINPDLFIFKPDGGKIREDGTVITDYYGSEAKNLDIRKASDITYPLWVGEHQVTAANKDDIPVTGIGAKASYDPATYTLTLKNVTGFDGTIKDNIYYYSHFIYSEIADLTIKGDCDIYETGVDSAIYSTGTVYIDGNLSICLNGSLVNSCIRTEGDLLIEGGHSILSSPDSGFGVLCNTFYMIDGYLEVCGYSKGVNTIGGGDVVFNGGFLRAEAKNTSYGAAVSSNGGIYFNNNEEITNPVGGKKLKIGTYTFIVDSSDNYALVAEVGVEETGYSLLVTGMAVTNKNRFDIEMKGLSTGTVSYNPQNNTLNFDNVSAGDTNTSFDPVVESYIDDMVITGNAYLDYPETQFGFYSGENFSIEGDFELTAKESAIKSFKNVGLISGESTFIARDNTNGIAAQAAGIMVYDGTYTFGGPKESVDVSQFTLMTGIKFLNPTYARFDALKRTVVDGGGLYVTTFTIGPEKYGLKIGGVQITSKNCNSIPNVYGGAHYEPATKTLYWDDNTVLNNKSTVAMIDSDDDLTITGRMHLNDTYADYGIRCQKNLTIIGVVYVKSGCVGTYVKDDLTIAQTSGGFAYLSSKALKDSNGQGIYCEGNVFVNDKCDLDGDGTNIGVYAAKNIEVGSDGSCDGSGKSYGVLAGKDIKLKGAMHASGNVEAIKYSGSIEIDPNYGIVKGNKYGNGFFDPAISATHLSDDKKHFFTADNQVAKQVSIDDRFFIYVGNKKITYETRNDIKGLDTGKGSYDPDTNTLTLEDALITEPWEDCIDALGDFTLVTKGDVKVINKGSWGCGIYTNGKLTIDGPIYIKSEFGAIEAADFELKNGYEILIPEGGKFDPKKKSIVDKDGKIANIVEIGKKDNGATPGATPTPTPGTTPEPGTVSAGNTIEEVETVILSLPNDDDPAGSDFATLQAKASKVTKNSIKLTWKKVAGAKSYYIYGNKCGTKNKYKKIKVVTKNSFTQKKLKKGTYYKYLVVAVDKDGKVLSTSKTIHAATTGGKVGNAKSLSTKAKKNKVSIKKGKSFKLKAKQKPVSKKLKIKKHREIKYESTNTEIATVSAKGVIKGVKKGTCYVYVYAQNGITKKIKVTVK